VGSTDLAAVMLTGELWFKVPQSIKFIISGGNAKMGFRKGSDLEYSLAGSASTELFTGQWSLPVKR